MYLNSYLQEKKGRIKALGEERKGLVKQLPKAKSPEEEKTQKELQEIRTSLAVLQKEAGEDKQKLQKIKDIRTALTSFTARMDRFYTELEPILKEVGIAQADRAIYMPAFPGDTEEPLARREKEINNSLAKREGDKEKPTVGTICAFEEHICRVPPRRKVQTRPGRSASGKSRSASA